MHNAFHVSLLKKKLGKGYSTTVHLLEIDELGSFVTFPLGVMARRTIKRDNKAVVQVLIFWEKRSSDEATWEDYH